MCKITKDELDRLLAENPPMSPEEADAAYDAAPEAPLSKEEIDRIVKRVVQETNKEKAMKTES